MMISDFVYRMNGQIERYVYDHMERTDAKSVGLDPRSAYELYITKDGIAVSKDEDRRLQYYGGFEYVSKEFRTELGEYVFYSIGDDRVYECLDRFYSTETEEAA